MFKLTGMNKKLRSIFSKKKVLSVTEQLEPQMPVVVYDYRRVGNTTRIVDFLIQVLFTRGQVKVYDHWIGSRSVNTDREGDANRERNRVFHIVMRRLEMEHPNVKVVASPKNVTIVLVKPTEYILNYQF